MYQRVQGPVLLTILLLLQIFCLPSCSNSNSNHQVLEEGGMEGTGLAEGGMEGSGLTEGGMEGTGIIQGKISISSFGGITGFGSVYVNGVKFETDNAEVVINAQANQSDANLQLGMVVYVEGYIDAAEDIAVATKIIYDRNLSGPISRVAIINDRKKLITVLGVAVEVSDETVFDGVAFEALVANQHVEVSGFMRRDGSFLANRIEIASVDGLQISAFETEGNISRIDTVSQTFVLGSATIDYSLATAGLPVEQLIVGAYVEVKGAAFNGSGELVATQISTKGDVTLGADNISTEIEGVLDEIESLQRFWIGNQEINGMAASIEKGSAAVLVQGVRLEVEGTVDSESVLQAERIIVKQLSDKAIEGVVTDIDLVNRIINIADEAVTIDDTTLFLDSTEIQSKYFNVNEIAVGDALIVRVVEFQGSNVANSIERVLVSNALESEPVPEQVDGADPTATDDSQAEADVLEERSPVEGESVDEQSEADNLVVEHTEDENTESEEDEALEHESEEGEVQEAELEEAEEAEEAESKEVEVEEAEAEPEDVENDEIESEDTEEVESVEEAEEEAKEEARVEENAVEEVEPEEVEPVEVEEVEPEEFEAEEAEEVEPVEVEIEEVEPEEEEEEPHDEPAEIESSEDKL